MKVLVVEDENQQALDNIEKIKAGLGKDTEIIGPYTEFKEVLPHIKSKEIDLAVLDIQLFEDRYAGIHIGETIEAYCNIPIIFVTGLSDKRILEQTEKINNCFYLKKPYDEQSFHRALKSVSIIAEKSMEAPGLKIAFKTRNKDKFWIKHGKSNQWGFEVDEIKWVEVKGHYCYFAEITGLRGIRIKTGLNALCDLLLPIYGDTFYRINNNIVINTQHICSMSGKKLYMKDPPSNPPKEFIISDKRKSGLLGLLEV